MRVLPHTAAALLALAAASPAALVWWEAELPRESNFPDRTWFSPATDREREKLSEGNWLSSDGQRQGPAFFAVYDVTAPDTATYHFWTRKFWKHGPFRWRFDDGPWTSCGRDIALADTVVLRKHVCANWVALGDVALTEGPHALRIELLAAEGEKATSAFDAFVLTTMPFAARGRLKPGEKTGEAPAGWFAFEPDPDPFGDAALDLRSLNHAVAGEGSELSIDLHPDAMYYLVAQF